MKHIKLFEAFVNGTVNEALTSKSPEETVTIELDMAFDDQDAEELKAAQESWKKFNIEVEELKDADQPGVYSVTGKKKDILAYLQSDFYEMDDETVQEYYAELLT